MSDVEARTDAKVGYSSMCRHEAHAQCQAARANCTCRCHGRRGSTAPTPSTPSRSKEHRMAEPALKSVPDTPVGLHVELVAEDPPPARSGRTGVVDKILELLPEMHAGRWYKVATFPAKSSANSAKTQMAKRGPGNVEWAARINGQGSALYGRKK